MFIISIVIIIVFCGSIRSITINHVFGFVFRLIGLFFPKEFVREKSDSQMQGDEYIINALDINATIRAYQVSISPRDSCVCSYSHRSSLFFYLLKRHVVT